MSKDLFGEYKLVLGLEIHLHLNTDTKMFCRCSAKIEGLEPNSNTCPTCLGLPGALPVPNADAVRKTQLLGLALGSEIAADSKFDRKHYFYPDLPKGYQISQYKEPFCLGGSIELPTGNVAELERIHLEEDTAKSIHEGSKTLIDFNMSSMPLVEIVTKPTFKTIEEASEFGRYIQKTVKELGLGDVNMEKGQMRLEPNISLRTAEMEAAGELPEYKVEIKNINSFRFMEKAVRAEVKRQRAMLENGETPIQENRGYNEETQSTVGQRSKESAHDYRYFPEPDIPPMRFDDAYMVALKKEFEEISSKTPSAQKMEEVTALQIPDSLKERVVALLSSQEIKTLLETVDLGADAKEATNAFLNKKEVRSMSAKEIVSLLAEKKEKVSDESELDGILDQVIEANEDAVQSYKSGKESALQFLVGMVMRETKGKAAADVVIALLKKKLD